jgi:hypothetical protein
MHRIRPRTAIMNFFSRFSNREETNPLQLGTTIATARNKKSIYFRLKRLAIEVIEEHHADFDATSSGICGDLVKRFIYFVFVVAGRAKTCIKSARKFLGIMKRFPNKSSLFKIIQKLGRNKTEE